MSTRSDSGLRRRRTERPDAGYALVAGLYVAALLAPAAVAVLSALTPNPAARYVGLLVVVTVVAAGASWTVSRVPGLAVELGRRDASWLLAAVPFGWVAVSFVALAVVGVDVPTVVLLLGMFAAAGGTFLGIALVAMSRTRHANAELDGVDDLARWEARWPPRWRRVVVGGAVVGVVLFFAGVVARLAFGWEWSGPLYVLLLFWTAFAGMTNARTFRATETGLAVEQPLQRQFRPWSAYESYELTDDALVVRPAAPWRPAHGCDRADVEELDAVLAALDRHCRRTVS